MKNEFKRFLIKINKDKESIQYEQRSESGFDAFDLAMAFIQENKLPGYSITVLRLD